MTGKIEQVQTRVRFVCPFCGRMAEVIEPPGVIHEQPACKLFIQLEPHEYLHEVNTALARDVQ